MSTVTGVLIGLFVLAAACLVVIAGGVKVLAQVVDALACLELEARALRVKLEEQGSVPGRATRRTTTIEWDHANPPMTHGPGRGQ